MICETLPEHNPGPLYLALGEQLYELVYIKSLLRLRLVIASRPLLKCTGFSVAASTSEDGGRFIGYGD